jgi:hypothetical protein
MVETWEHLRGVPMVDHVRRILMEALEVEKSIEEGEPALQALIKCAREHAGKLEAHEAEKGISKRLLPIGLAAMQLSFAERGPGDVRPALSRADGVLLAREKSLGAVRPGAGCGLPFVPPLELVDLGAQGVVAGSHLGHLSLQQSHLLLQLPHQREQSFSTQRGKVFQHNLGKQDSP